MRTRFKKYIEDDKVVVPIASDKDIRVSSDLDGDELVWCADAGGENPDVVIVAKRGKILSVTVGGRRID